MKQKTIKSILSMILVAVMCFSLVPMNAFAADSDFVIENGVLTKYTGNGSDVVIPEGVTSIADFAFYSCTSLASITIPEGVTSIGNSAFSWCTSLASITIPEGVTSIGGSAFSDCTSLASITIPEGVTSIGDFALSDCTSLASITIPEGVTSIGDYAFSGCTSLASITIPEGVTSIGECAFYKCKSLASITIPEGVTSIGGSAFSDCTSLASITIPEGVTSIGEVAFGWCTSLASVTMPEGVTSIGMGAFYQCRSLASITIPEGVTSIGEEAFFLCTSLASITIPEGVTSIGDDAFSETIVKGKSGSVAETFVKEHNLKKAALGDSGYWITFEAIDGTTPPPTTDKPSAWAEANINTAITANIVPQTLQSAYTQATTRAEFAALAVKLYEKVKGTEITERTTFNDTTDVNIQKAAAIGVVSGVGNNNFAPNDKLTREQAATMLSRLAAAIGKPLTEQAATFADNGKISTWAAAAVGQMQASGIMGGVGNNTFAPQDDYTREQSIATALRLYDIVNQK